MSADNRFAGRLISDDAVLAMIDHQTGLLVNCREQESGLPEADMKAGAAICGRSHHCW